MAGRRRRVGIRRGDRRLTAGATPVAAGRAAPDERGDLQTVDRRASEVTLAAVQRRRWQLWLVAGFFIIAASVAVVLSIGGAAVEDSLLDTPALRYGFLGMAVAFLLYVADQERVLRRLTEGLVDQRVLTASLEQRISDLSELSKVGRAVNAVLTMDEVLEAILRAAFELTGAINGSVMLRDGDDLEVRSSAGPNAAPVHARSRVDQGVAGWVASHREPLIISGRLANDQLPGLQPRSRPSGSAVCAPLVVSDEVIGVLSLERPAQGPAFSQLQSSSVALFADHAAAAVANAMRFEHERETVEKLADVIELRSEFVATLVHDLKSPLTTVMGFASMLRRRWDALSIQQREHAIDAIEQQAMRLVSMVDEVLRTSAIEAGAELGREPVDLSTVLHELADTVLSPAEDGRAGRHVTLTGTDVPMVVSGDAEALRHVFSNLLDNAIKYSPPGTPVELVIESVGDQCRVHVTDHGRGIPVEDVATIFERFRQARGGAAGVGLGLYIVRTLVSAHGGRVSVESELGEGTTFTVELPLLRSEVAAT